MKIYVAHAKAGDFKTELYDPIKTSELFKEHAFVLPHEMSDGLFDSKNFFKTDCDLVIAEVSVSATGLGIELGWADLLNVPIVCISKKDSKISGSLKAVAQSFFEYTDSSDLIQKIREAISSSHPKN